MPEILLTVVVLALGAFLVRQHRQHLSAQQVQEKRN